MHDLRSFSHDAREIAHHLRPFPDDRALGDEGRLPYSFCGILLLLTLLGSACQRSPRALERCRGSMAFALNTAVVDLSCFFSLN